MADTESLGEAGVRFLEGLAAAPEAERRVRVPAITDPRGIDFAVYRRLGQTPQMAALEQRTITALRAFGVLMTDTCINYQTIMAPVRGDHLAYGDTGVVIYSNSVLGARSNFEGGPSALAAALTGRTPRYGYHLDARRRGTRRFRLAAEPRDLTEWGAVGGIIGEACGSYWEVPVIEGVERVPGSDALKHFGAALASFGSVALFHMPGVTAEETEFAGSAPAAVLIGRDEIEAFLARYAARGDKLDVVVFAAPQLSLFEVEAGASALEGRRVHRDTTVIVATSPEIKHAADRMDLTTRIEASGAVVAQGICFYQSYAREMAEANGWTRLMTNSAKLVNIIGGYGYRPTLASLERCIDSAVAGVCSEAALVKASIKDNVLHLEFSRWSKLLAISGSLDIPLRCLKHAAAGPPGLPVFRLTDLRTGGTSMPGILAAGRFSMGSPHRRTFLDLRRSSKQVLSLELENYRYDAVLVEVEDVARVLEMINDAATKAVPL